MLLLARSHIGFSRQAEKEQEFPANLPRYHFRARRILISFTSFVDTNLLENTIILRFSNRLDNNMPNHKTPFKPRRTTKREKHLKGSRNHWVKLYTTPKQLKIIYQTYTTTSQVTNNREDASRNLEENGK